MFPLHDDLVAHNKVLAEAADKYLERDQVHRGLWKQDEPDELAAQALHKAKRLQALTDSVYEPDSGRAGQAIDDALDMINYAVFTIRRLRGEC